MKLSNKKETELYRLVSDEIMEARIKVAKLLNGSDGNRVDEILYKLMQSAPQKAIDFFKPTPNNGTV